MDVSAELFAKMENLLIVVEIHPTEVDRFKMKYIEATAEHPSEDNILPREAMHLGGGNCRFYFNASVEIMQDLFKLGWKAYCGKPSTTRGPFHQEYKYRMDSNHLFWLLVRNGFRLHPKAEGWPKLCLSKVPAWKDIQPIATRSDEPVKAVKASSVEDFDSIEVEVKRLKTEAESLDRSVSINRSIGCNVTAQDAARKAAAIRQRIKKLEAKQETILATV